MTALEQARKTLTEGTPHVAIITPNRRLWWEAKGFVNRTLGRPITCAIQEWTYPNGKAVRFYTEQDTNVDEWGARPIMGFDGTVIWFGYAECDEVHGIMRAEVTLHDA